MTSFAKPTAMVSLGELSEFIGKQWWDGATCPSLADSILKHFEVYPKALAEKAHRRRFTVGVMDDEEEVRNLAAVPTGQLFNEILSRFAFESNGVDPRSLSLIELKKAIVGAEWPGFAGGKAVK